MYWVRGSAAANLVVGVPAVVLGAMGGGLAGIVVVLVALELGSVLVSEVAAYYAFDRFVVPATLHVQVTRSALPAPARNPRRVLEGSFDVAVAWFIRHPLRPPADGAVRPWGPGRPSVPSSPPVRGVSVGAIVSGVPTMLRGRTST